MNWPTKALMVDPQFFDVEYAINPHMLNTDGELNTIDKAESRKQWEDLKAKFQEIGTHVETLPGVEGLPDMVFCANQTFPFIKNGKLKIVLSQMNSEKRQPEVEHFKSWADRNDVETFEIDSNFEGMGDALWNYETGEVFGGYGFRTSPELYAQLQKIIDQKITTFELKDDRFYHLDTCLAILRSETAAFVKEAFTKEGLETLQKSFSNLIEIPIEEATNQLACNMCTPNGKDVLLEKGATKTNQLLKEAGFNVHEMETGEYIKSGGSVFCMKILLP